MKATSIQKRKGHFAIGGIGLLFSASYLGISFQLPFGQMDQPGAALFPVIAGVLFMIGSITTLWEAFLGDKTEQVALPTGTDLRRLLILIALLLGYFLVLPSLGQILSSLLFCILLIHLLSDLSWIRILLYSMIVSSLLYVVFVFFLKVPMPRGMMGF